MSSEQPPLILEQQPGPPAIRLDARALADVKRAVSDMIGVGQSDTDIQAYLTENGIVPGEDGTFLAEVVQSDGTIAEKRIAGS